MIAKTRFDRVMTKSKILIVDDHPIIRQGLMRLIAPGAGPRGLRRGGQRRRCVPAGSGNPAGYRAGGYFAQG